MISNPPMVDEAYERFLELREQWDARGAGGSRVGEQAPDRNEATVRHRQCATASSTRC